MIPGGLAVPGWPGFGVGCCGSALDSLVRFWWQPVQAVAGHLLHRHIALCLGTCVLHVEHRSGLDVFTLPVRNKPSPFGHCGQGWRARRPGAVLGSALGSFSGGRGDGTLVLSASAAGLWVGSAGLVLVLVLLFLVLLVLWLVLWLVVLLSLPGAYPSLSGMSVSLLGPGFWASPILTPLCGSWLGWCVAWGLALGSGRGRAMGGLCSGRGRAFGWLLWEVTALLLHFCLLLFGVVVCLLAWLPSSYVLAACASRAAPACSWDLGNNLVVVVALGVLLGKLSACRPDSCHRHFKPPVAVQDCVGQQLGCNPEPTQNLHGRDIPVDVSQGSQAMLVLAAWAVPCG